METVCRQCGRVRERHRLCILPAAHCDAHAARDAARRDWLQDPQLLHAHHHHGCAVLHHAAVLPRFGYMLNVRTCTPIMGALTEVCNCFATLRLFYHIACSCCACLTDLRILHQPGLCKLRTFTLLLMSRLGLTVPCPCLPGILVSSVWSMPCLCQVVPPASIEA